MSNNRNGPEFAPVRNFINTFPIEVVIYDTNDKEIRREIMDYGKPDDRNWLGKLSWWAWSSGYIVETAKKV